MFKICLIGCGGMANGGHAPSLKQYTEVTPDTELSACCDVDEERARKFYDKFGFRQYFTDYHEMMDAIKPDVVLVIVPPSLTKKISVDVMNKGYNVLLEKPPGLNVGEAMEIHECALKNHVHARVAFNRRYMPVLNELVKEIKACGKPIHHADCQFIRVSRSEPDFCTTAIHSIDLIRRLLL